MSSGPVRLLCLEEVEISYVIRSFILFTEELDYCPI